MHALAAAGSAATSAQRSRTQSADLLEVLDERVAASSHLADISNAIFQPTSLLGLRPPEVALPSHAPEDEGDEATKRPSDDIVDEHLKHLALDKKEERRQALRKAWQGTVAFIKTPLGALRDTAQDCALTRLSRRLLCYLWLPRRRMGRCARAHAHDPIRRVPESPLGGSS